jgi:hypothetical protein
MKYIISRWKIENLKEELGTDVSHFHIFLQIENDPELPIPFMLDFEKYHRHISSTHPELGKYISDIRNNIGGYGPKHSQVVATLEEEDFDFLTHLESYITEEKVQQHMAYSQRLADPANDTANKAAAFLETMITEEMKESNLTYGSFIESIDQALHEVVFKHYPALFEKGKDTVTAYRSLLVRTTLDFAAKVDKLNAE